jgi:hypothetical protein
MAVSRITSGALATSFGNGDRSINVAVPTHVAGDVLFVVVHGNGNDVITASQSGWSSVVSEVAHDNQTRLRVWSRLATASEPSTYGFTITQGLFTAGGLIGQITSYRGVDPNTHIVWALTGTTNRLDLGLSLGTLLFGDGDACEVAMTSNSNHAGESHTGPSSYTQAYMQAGTGRPNGSRYFRMNMTEGTQSITVSSNFAVTGSGAAWTINAAPTSEDHQRAITDSAGATDVVSRVASSVRAIIDSAGVTDTLDAIIIRSRALTDDSGASDAFTSQQMITRTFIDSAGMSDAIVAASGKIREIVDSAGMTDVLVIPQQRMPFGIEPRAYSVIEIVFLSTSTLRAANPASSAYIEASAQATMHSMRALATIQVYPSAHG